MIRFHPVTRMECCAGRLFWPDGIPTSFTGNPRPALAPPSCPLLPTPAPLRPFGLKAASTGLAARPGAPAHRTGAFISALDIWRLTPIAMRVSPGSAPTVACWTDAGPPRRLGAWERLRDPFDLGQIKSIDPRIASSATRGCKPPQIPRSGRMDQCEDAGDLHVETPASSG